MQILKLDSVWLGKNVETAASSPQETAWESSAVCSREIFAHIYEVNTHHIHCSHFSYNGEFPNLPEQTEMLMMIYINSRY